MRRDREQRESERVTRRSGTRVGVDFETARDRSREGSYRDEYTYLDERNMRDERRYRDERDDRRYRDERDDRRYRDERDDRRYRDERDDRRYRDERDDRRYRDERDDHRYRDERDDRRYRDERDDRRYRDERDDRRYRNERDDRRNRDERDDRRESEAQERREPKSVTKGSAGARSGRGGNPDRTVHQLVPYVLFCLSVFAGVSFFLRDFTGLEGQTGAFGSFLADFLCGLFGITAYALPVWMFVLALRWRHYVKTAQLVKKLVLSSSFLVLLSGIIHVFQENSITRGWVDTSGITLYGNGVARVGGGFFGGFAGEWIGYVLRLPGTIILAIPLLLIISIYLIGMTPSGLWKRISSKVQTMRQKHSERRAAMYDGTQEVHGKKREKDKEPEVSAKEQTCIAVTKWSDPRPLEQSVGMSGVFSFSDEEDEPIVLKTSARTKEHDPAPAQKKEESVNPASAFTSPMQATSVAHSPAPETVLRETIREQAAAQPAQQAQPAESAEDLSKSGQVYAPFALPVQPFPKRTAQAAEASVKAFEPAVQAHCKENTPPPVKQQAEEVLGAFSAVNRPTPVREETHSTSAHLEVSREVPSVSVPFAASTASAATETVHPAAQKKEETDEFSYFASVQKTDTSQPVVAFASDEPLDTFEDFAPRNAKTVPCAEPAVSRESETAYAKEEIGAAFESVPTVTVPAFEHDYLAHTVRVPEQDDPYEDLDEEDTVLPITVQSQRVEPQAVPTPSYTPVAAFDPPQRPAPRVEVKSAPIKSVSAEVAPVVTEYKHPPVDLLNEDKNIRTDDFYEEIEETKDILRQTMASFNIRIQDEINYSHGPSVTRYEMRPVAGTSVRSVTNRAEDIALNLASSVRIEAPIPGKPAIGIEVPNKMRETVYMRTMLESEEFKRSTDPLDVPLGLDVGGDVRMCNLAKMPHLLVAGTTGSGKSVCINTILLSLIYKTSPEDLRLILIDPKQIEFAPYEDVPHLYMPIVTDMQRAAGALACAVQEMERRFSLIKDVGVRNIEAYNEAVRNDPDREHLPYIVIVIDEFNDLKMSCNNNDPENFTVRIAQKARAAGIHLIIGTQRPSVDVITGKLKGNIPSRIAFMVKQQVDSRTILDVNGAEALTGRGDMLYMATNASDKNPVRIQGAFVSDGELERVISYVRRHNAPVQYNRAFMDQIEVEMARAAKQDRKGDDFDIGDEDEGGEDPKFVEAVELSLQAQKVATSLLQRRLGVGYGRAAKIIDRMEELGLVSPAEGNKPRKILPAAQGYLAHIGALDADEGDFEDDYN